MTVGRLTALATEELEREEGKPIDLKLTRSTTSSAVRNDKLRRYSIHTEILFVKTRFYRIVSSRKHTWL